MNYNISYHDMLTSNNNDNTDSITLYPFRVRSVF